MNYTNSVSVFSWQAQGLGLRLGLGLGLRRGKSLPEFFAFILASGRVGKLHEYVQITIGFNVVLDAPDAAVLFK
jgi:hypothetical protein